MQVERIGFTPLKGGRHVEHPEVELGPAGPVGDRVLCLVDPARERVLRTIDHPALVRAVVSLRGRQLSVALDGALVEGVPGPTGERHQVDYWGRRVGVETVDGPWSDLFSAVVGRRVVLARPDGAGDVVYGGAVSLVTTASLADLSARLGAPVDGVRFRPTFVVENASALEETRWTGREVAIGSAVVRVRGAVPRCGVVDLDPASGERDLAVLKALAGYGRAQGEVTFGVDAEVVRPGRVTTGDALVVGGAGV